MSRYEFFGEIVKRAEKVAEKKGFAVSRRRLKSDLWYILRTARTWPDEWMGCIEVVVEADGDGMARLVAKPGCLERRGTVLVVVNGDDRGVKSGPTLKDTTVLIRDYHLGRPVVCMKEGRKLFCRLEDAPYYLSTVGLFASTVGELEEAAYTMLKETAAGKSKPTELTEILAREYKDRKELTRILQHIYRVKQEMVKAEKAFIQASNKSVKELAEGVQYSEKTAEEIRKIFKDLAREKGIIVPLP